MTTPKGNTQVLTSTPNDSAAAMIVDALKSEGIKGTAEPEPNGEMRIVVRSRDLERAQRILDEYQRVCSDVDWSDVD